MNLNIRLLVLAVSLLTLFSITNPSIEASTNSTLQYQGCWSPHPNCAGSRDVFTENGKVYFCGSCDGNADACYQVDQSVLPRGYWCD